MIVCRLALLKGSSRTLSSRSVLCYLTSTCTSYRDAKNLALTLNALIVSSFPVNNAVEGRVNR